MKVRTLKRRHDRRTTFKALLWAGMNDDMRWHTLEYDGDDPWDDDQDDTHCFDCGELHDMCECHVGAECGRWRNGRLSDSCSKAGSEECDFECPYGR